MSQSCDNLRLAPAIAYMMPAADTDTNGIVALKCLRMLPYVLALSACCPGFLSQCA